MANKKRRSRRSRVKTAQNDLSSSDDDSIIDDSDNELEDPTYMPEKDPNETEVSSSEEEEGEIIDAADTATDADEEDEEDDEDEEDEEDEDDEDEDDEDEEYYEYEEDDDYDGDDAEDEEYSSTSQNATATHPLAPIEMKSLNELPKEIQNSILSMQKKGTTGTHIRFDNNGSPYMLIINGRSNKAENNKDHTDCVDCKGHDKIAPKRGRDDEVAFTAKFTKEENEYWKRMSPPEKDSLLDKFKDMKSKNKSQNLPLRFKLLQADLDASSKSLILAKLDQFQKMPDSSGEYFKLRNWLNGISRLPLGVYKSLPIKETTYGKHTDSVNFLKEVKTTLDKTVFGQNDVKNQLMRIMAQWISNPDAKGNCIGLQGSPGVGKCLAKGTEIIMYDGTIKKVENIENGDLLMGDDSKSRTVLSLGRGKDKMYEITNVKGDKYIVNSEHILSLKYSGKKYIQDRPDRNSYQIKYYNQSHKYITISYKNKDKEEVFKEAEKILEKTTENLYVDMSIQEFLKLPKSVRERLKGYKVGIEFQEIPVELDPYMLGIWLGDGNKTNTNITTQDASTNHFKYVLKKYNLLHNKHIPYDYKCNSRENRLKLLAGLIDSDGGYEQGCLSITQSIEHEKLLDDIIYLARSLGFACYKNKKTTSWTYKEEYKRGEAWRINISGEGIEEIPILCPRKKPHARRQIKDALVSTISIKELPVDDYYGFELNGNGRFILSNFVVTHNTSLIKQGLCTALGLPFGFISLGGASDASFLEGHGFTYEGSTYGKVAEILMKTKCMNPVFFFDELDKVSHTYRGEEIIGILTHLTDSSQNERFNDRYFGEIDLNLSKALIIFSYNDESKINHILKDRMITIHVDGYDMNDKVNIAKDYLIPELLKEYRRTAEDIIFSKEVIEKIIDKVSKEEGVRNLKRGLESIISWLNMHTYLPVVEEDSKGRPGKTLKIKLGDTTTTNAKLYTYPVIVTEEHIEKYIKDDPEEAARAMVTHSMYL